jgi:CheY-like chemotaxis protein
LTRPKHFDSPSAPRDLALSLEGVSVFVVDDQEEARVVLTHALSEYGAQVTTVSSGTGASDRRRLPALPEC